MGVQGRDDAFVMLVLKISQFLWEQACVMVINRGYSSHDPSLGRNHRRSYQPVPDQAPEHLGSVIVTFIGDELIKTIE
jgi:hypothetical protein